MREGTARTAHGFGRGGVVDVKSGAVPAAAAAAETDVFFNE